jgi:hypothetical protein
MRRVLVVAVAVVLSACSDDSPLSPADIAGTYALNDVNGAGLGVPHQLGGASCTAAFTDGSMTINQNDQFSLNFTYRYLCEGETAPGLLLQLIIVGDEVRNVGEWLYMTGTATSGTCGPAGQGPQACPFWGIAVRPELPMIRVEFLDARAAFWADPRFTLGPRQQ